MTNEKILLQLEKGYDIKNPQLAQALSNLEDKIGITKAELEEAIEAKANLVGGKVPAEELPSYVDDVIEFNGLLDPSTRISTIVGNSSNKNRTYFINGSDPNSGRVGSSNKYPYMFVNFGENTSEEDWISETPERGKIYLNISNDHSYRWTGSELLDLDKNWSTAIVGLSQNTIRTDTPQDFSTERENQALSNIGSGLFVVDLIDGKATLTADQEAKLLSSSGVILRGTVNAGKEVLTKIYFADYQQGDQVSFWAVRNNRYILQCIYTKSTKIFQFLTSGSYIDPNAVSIKSQTLTSAQQDVALSNIGLDFVHVDHSLLGTTLTDAQVESVSNSRGIILTNVSNYDGPTVFIKGHTGSTGQLFFAQDSSSVVRQISFNLNNKTLSTISSIELHFDSVRYSVTQNLTDAQKQLARDNIGAISSDDIPSGGGLSESDLVSIDSDRNIVVASESVESDYPYPKLIVPESSQPQQGSSLTLTDSQILGTLKQTVGGNDVLPSRVLLIFTGSDSHQYQYILYRSYTYLEVSDTLYQYVYYESIGGEWSFRFDANNMDPSKILSRKAANS
jgi:hypothetical protein